MQTRKLDTGEVELELAEAGAGSPKHLMFLHGFGGAKEDFTEWLDRFAGAGWHAVAFDQRGHGSSAKPAGRSTIPCGSSKKTSQPSSTSWAGMLSSFSATPWEE